MTRQLYRRQRRASGTLAAIASAAVLCLLLPGTAYAYLDAGTGSMVLQVVIATVTGALIAIRLYWGRIKARFFAGQSIEAEEGTSDEPANEPS